MSVTFCIIWAASTLACLWFIFLILSRDGEVNNLDRFLIFVSLFPVFSTILAWAIGVSLLALWMEHIWYNSPKITLWRLERKIRKRRRGPFVRIVQHLHKKRKEKENETKVP